MRTEKLVAMALYQAEVVTKRRSSQRRDVVCHAEFEVNRIKQCEAVFDALVATGSRFWGNPSTGPVSYLGYDGALWQPLLSWTRAGHVRVSIDAFREKLRQSPTSDARRSGNSDPMREADDPDVGFAEQHYYPQRMVSEETFDGAIYWTNKARALQLQQEAAQRLLLIVGDVVYRRSLGPVWVTSGPKSYRHGAVMLRQPDSSDYHGDTFAPTKLQLAKSWCERRWGECVVSGSIEYLDERFVDDRLYGARLVDHWLAKLVDNGARFLPYWPSDAVLDYLALAREMRTSKPLKIFGVRDPGTVRALAAALRPHIAAPSVPSGLRRVAKDLLADLDYLTALSEFDRSLFGGLNPNQAEDLAELAVAP
ncbi:hypothetical protein ACVIGB_000418 [Bradyrhizobium sp. USDA 4341]